jgi:hypothetical protein
MWLDVGCGSLPKGDVNCDLYVRDVGHREFPVTLNLRSIPNFVLCSAKFLPFKNGCFEVVVSSHCIEHVSNPDVMLAEMWRVCNFKVKVVCPHGFGDRLARRNRRIHINSLSGQWFKSQIKKLGCGKSSIRFSSYYYIPHKYVPLMRFPLEITVVLFKKSRFKNE